MICLVALFALFVTAADDAAAAAATPDGTTPPVDDKKAQDCEVCIGVLARIEAKVRDEKLTDLEKIEKVIVQECKAATHVREKRFCWYIGAAKDSATNILREVSKPLSMGMPGDAICQRRLKKKDGAICGLRYEGSNVVDDAPPSSSKPKPKPKPKAAPKIDFNGLNKLKIKDLKEILSQNGLDCDGCTEKGDYVRKIKTLQPEQKKDEL